MNPGYDNGRRIGNTLRAVALVVGGVLGPAAVSGCTRPFSNVTGANIEVNNDPPPCVTLAPNPVDVTFEGSVEYSPATDPTVLQALEIKRIKNSNYVGSIEVGLGEFSCRIGPGSNSRLELNPEGLSLMSEYLREHPSSTSG